MNLSVLSHRFRWLHLPTGMLIMLLQRTPAPVLRALAQLDSLVADQATVILRSSVAVAAMGAYHSVAGATVFNVAVVSGATVTPASGAANSTFTVSATNGTALNLGISVSGAPGNPKSWSVKTTPALPTGLSVTGGNPINVVAPYKMYIAGTPTAAGSTSVTVTAWDGLNGTGGNSAKITVTFNITGGAVSTAPAITTQPSSQAVTAGGTASFTVAASGSPTPTYQWAKGGVNISGATSATLALSNVQAADAGTYTATATNSAGSATSTGAVLTVNAAAVAPAITTQPSSQAVTAGGTASFTVAASGSPTPTYQWAKGGVNISGATSATLSLSNVQAGDAGTYTAVATNSAGSATSTGAVLTVNAAAVAPAITTQPSSQAVTAGGTASFTVAASGSPTPTYQWAKGGVNISGATSATLALSNVQAADAGTYTATATNSAGTATSTGAVLTVNAATVAPAITTQPSSQAVTAGGTASFTVAASGSPTPTYQWAKGGVNISGATSATLTLSNVQAGDAGTYTAVATNSAGSATSTGAVLTVSASAVAPAIATQPSSQIVTAGATVTMTVAVTGSPTPTVQWKKDGTDLSGMTGTTLTLPSAQASDAGAYTAVATNSAGTATSATATLTVTDPVTTTAPAITTQPSSQTVTAGGTATLTVAASGSPTPTIQWTKNGLAITGATSPTLTLVNVQAADAATYAAVATNSAGTATSNGAVLTVAASSAPTILTQPQGHTVATGHSVVFGVEVSGGGLSYQWKKGGVAISGATGSQLLLSRTQASDAGSYAVTATNSFGAVTSNAATLTVATSNDPGRLVNVSVRTVSGTGADVLIMGFVTGGSGTSGTKQLLIRGIGPTLAGFGVPNVMLDPTLQIIPSGATLPTVSNDNWLGNATVLSVANAVGAFALPDMASKDAALVTSLSVGAFSAKVSGNSNTTGSVLAEIYDATPSVYSATAPRLMNVSARAPMTNDNPLIAGFVIGGSTAKTVMIRAIGPTLGTYGVGSALADPQLDLYVRLAGADHLMLANDNWGGAALLTSTGNAVGAFGLPDGASKDAVLLVTLDPGVYCAKVSGASNTAGIALVEVYEIP